MAYPSQNRGFLKSRRALFIVAVFCFPPDSTKGNSVVVLNETSGEFQSPGYPDLEDDMDCTWNISAPPYHRITITFLDFDLAESFFCKDEVEIHGSDVKGGPYRGTQLHQQNITSTSNTILVVLTSCSTSLVLDRRGIRVSYSTEETTTRRTTSITTIVNGPFSSQRNQKLSNVVAATAELSTRLLSSNNNSAEGSGKLIGALLAGLLAMAISIIIVFLIVKRRKTKSPSRNTTNRSGKVETNQTGGYFTTVVPGRNSVKSLDHDYLEVNEKQKDMNSVYYSSSIVSTSLDSSMLQKKHSQLDASNNLCVYENDASNKQNRTGYDQDYSHIIHKIHQPSPFATK